MVGGPIGRRGAVRPAATTAEQLRIVAEHEPFVDPPRHDVVRAQQQDEDGHQQDQKDDQTYRQVEFGATRTPDEKDLLLPTVALDVEKSWRTGSNAIQITVRRRSIRYTSCHNLLTHYFLVDMQSH